jgi:hypothetical protein
MLPLSAVYISHEFVGSKREVNPYADFSYSESSTYHHTHDAVKQAKHTKILSPTAEHPLLHSRGVKYNRIVGNKCARSKH